MMGPSYFTQVENTTKENEQEIEEDDFDIFERAGEQLYSQRRLKRDTNITNQTLGNL